LSGNVSSINQVFQLLKVGICGCGHRAILKVCYLSGSRYCKQPFGWG
jgi:hypothetical protein